MSTARVLRGAPVAKHIKSEVQTAADQFSAEVGARPTLATLLVGGAPASVAYRDAIARALTGCGLRHVDVELPVAATTGMVIEAVERLNAIEDVHGVLVLLPLPSHIDSLAVIASVDAAKDVDGVTPESAGKLSLGLPTLHPSTPQAGIEILDHYHIPIQGARAVVIGRSNVVGKPMAALLISRDATVTVCHRRTASLKDETVHADIVVMAAGHPGLLHGDMLRPGSTVIDFGVNVVGGRIVGDADMDSIAEVAGAYTPVPGGTTPVTTLSLARNTVTAAFRQIHGESSTYWPKVGPAKFE
jgi:methylenetetrahydrofolate dehydrogenase (NADP+)/methenyltetrahydrofolate cyclohydrolase